MRRRRSYANVTVPLDEIMSDLSDADLLEELAERGLGGAVDFADIERAWQAMREHRFGEAYLILDRICRPKFRTLAEAEAALARARGKVRR